jgi:hypothetical protein
MIPMFSDRELKLFRRYDRDTPHALKSGRGWGKYFKENAAPPVGAYDAKPARSRNPTFDEVCKYGRMAFDADFERRGGNVIGPSGKETPECLEDADPAAQAEVESTDNQPDHGPKGAAPPWGKHDEPRHAEPMEPNPNMGFDPYTERQRRAFGAAVGGHSALGIDPDFARRALHEDAALETVTHGQQGAEHGPEGWERTRGRDQEHEDEPEDERLIRKVLRKLGFKASDIDEAIARDRRSRRRMAGDRALARRSFHQMFPDAERLTSHGSGAVAFTPKVFVHRSRG